MRHAGKTQLKVIRENKGKGKDKNKQGPLFFKEEETICCIPNSYESIRLKD